MDQTTSLRTSVHSKHISNFHLIKRVLLSPIESQLKRYNIIRNLKLYLTPNKTKILKVLPIKKIVQVEHLQRRNPYVVMKKAFRKKFAMIQPILQIALTNWTLISILAALVVIQTRSKALSLVVLILDFGCYASILTPCLMSS